MGSKCGISACRRVVLNPRRKMTLQVLSLADCRRESALLEHRSRDLLSTTKLGRRLCPQGIVAMLTKARQHLNPMAHGVL